MRVLAKSLILSALVVTAASPAKAQTQENEAMAQRVAQELKESGRLKNYRVGVQFQEGVAWLSGTVASREQREIAQSLAAQTDGVKRVVNRLEIATPPQPEAETADPWSDTTLARTPIDEDLPVPIRAASMPVQQNMAPQLGPEPRAMSPQPAGPGMVQTAGPVQGMVQGPVSQGMGMTGGPMPIGYSPQGMARTVGYDHPAMPGYAWPSYAAYPNYGALTYPRQYSAAAWPYIGPFYPYPQVPLGWRKVTLEWDDGWWFLDFKE